MRAGPAGGSTGVSSQWQQAGLTCTDPNSVTYVSFWVGLDGLKRPSVEQTGALGWGAEPDEDHHG